jgi:hypothetical protein
VQNYHDMIVKKFLSVADDETGLKMLILTDKREILSNMNKLLKTNDHLSISLVIKRCIRRKNVYAFVFVDFEPNGFISVCCFRC